MSPRRGGPGNAGRGKGRAQTGSTIPSENLSSTSRPTQTAQRAAEPLPERPYEVAIQVTLDYYQWNTTRDGLRTNKKLPPKGTIARVKPDISLVGFKEALNAQVEPAAGSDFQAYDTAMPQFCIPRVPLFQPRTAISRKEDLKAFMDGLSAQGWPIPMCNWTIQVAEERPAPIIVADAEPEELPMEVSSPPKKARTSPPNKRAAAAALASDRLASYETGLSPHLGDLREQWPLCSRLSCRGGQSQGGCCYVTPAGEHFYVSPVKLRKWATRMLHDPDTFTVDNPPNNLFDRPAAPRGLSSPASSIAEPSAAGSQQSSQQSSQAASQCSSSSSYVRAFADRTNISRASVPDESDEGYSISGVQDAIKALHEPAMSTARGPTMSTLHFIQEVHHGSHQIVIVLARLGITDMDVLADAFSQGEIVGKFIDVIVLRTIKSWLLAWVKLAPYLAEDKRKLRADVWMLEKAADVSVKSGFKAAAVDLLPRPRSAFPSSDTRILSIGSQSPPGSP